MLSIKPQVLPDLVNIAREDEIVQVADRNTVEVRRKVEVEEGQEGGEKEGKKEEILRVLQLAIDHLQPVTPTLMCLLERRECHHYLSWCSSFVSSSYNSLVFFFNPLLSG